MAKHNYAMDAWSCYVIGIVGHDHWAKELRRQLCNGVETTDSLDEQLDVNFIHPEPRCMKQHHMHAVTVTDERAMNGIACHHS